MEGEAPLLKDPATCLEFRKHFKDIEVTGSLSSDRKYSQISFLEKDQEHLYGHRLAMRTEGQGWGRLVTYVWVWQLKCHGRLVVSAMKKEEKKQWRVSTLSSKIAATSDMWRKDHTGRVIDSHSKWCHQSVASQREREETDSQAIPQGKSVGWAEWIQGWMWSRH